MNTSLLDHLRSFMLVADGASGTMLYARGVPMEVCFDEINLSRPDLIRKIHEEYVEAGAGLIETNTFGANALSLSKYNLEDQAETLNARGVEIAREAAGSRAYVAGAVGPARGLPHWDYTEADHRQVYHAEQIAALAGGGADAIILETFLRLDELKAALEVCKEICGLPTICQLAVDQYGQSDDGFEVVEAFDQLARGRRRRGGGQLPQRPQGPAGRPGDRYPCRRGWCSPLFRTPVHRSTWTDGSSTRRRRSTSLRVRSGCATRACG